MSEVADIDLGPRRKKDEGENRDEWARQNGFLILTPGEAYSRNVSMTGIVFVYQIDNGKWLSVYDNTNHDGKGNTYKSQYVKAGASKDGKDIFGVSWEKATENAIRFVKFMSNGGRRKNR